jgi:hypothetical protein
VTEPGEDFGEDPFFELARQVRPDSAASDAAPGESTAMSAGAAAAEHASPRDEAAAARPGRWWTSLGPGDDDEPDADPDRLPVHFRDTPRGSSEAISLAPAPRGRRRLLGHSGGESTGAFEPAVARPPVTAAPRVATPPSAPVSRARSAPAVTPYRRLFPAITPASVPGLDGYADDGEADAHDQAYDDRHEGKVGGAWRSATFILACATAALGIGFGVTFYQAFEFRNRASELEAVLPAAAIQMALQGDNIQGVAYFAPQFARGVLAIDGLQPPPPGQRVILWADSHKNGIAAVAAVVPDQYGSRIYVEIRRTPSDLVRLFATYEPAGRTLPTAPTGVEVLSGDAPLGIGPLQSPPAASH